MTAHSSVSGGSSSLRSRMKFNPANSLHVYGYQYYQNTYLLMAGEGVVISRHVGHDSTLVGLDAAGNVCQKIKYNLQKTLKGTNSLMAMKS